MPMTPEELEAHVQKELSLKAEIEALITLMRNAEYRTKTEKLYYADQLAAKRTELRVHLGIEE
jgi:hypothetical protein